MNDNDGRLTGMLVGLSVSDSPDLTARGLHKMHLEHAFIELARQLLATGANIAYGGDLRGGGFTERLMDLLHTYGKKNRPHKDRVREYLAWPLRAEALTKKEQEQLSWLENVVTVKRMAEPPELPAPVPAKLRKRIADARAFSAMRECMAADIDARIVLGGPVSGFKGRYPGVAEEALLTAAAGKPVYIIGGFGGCAKALANLVRGDEAADLTLDTLRCRDAGYAELLPYLEMDETFTAPLAGRGPEGLDNGLSGPENEALFESADIDEVVALMLRGLRNVQPRLRGRPPGRNCRPA
ncbi:hypothetical protein [Actinoplanes sp. NPDC049681]|uniref:hypothetical protein n=1 Tax=Actinoplanes sp. NPDC049681 TaxID=3363905 RepID=UPI0037965379